MNDKSRRLSITRLTPDVPDLCIWIDDPLLAAAQTYDIELAIHQLLEQQHIVQPNIVVDKHNVVVVGGVWILKELVIHSRQTPLVVVDWADIHRNALLDVVHHAQCLVDWEKM